jgi:hypothetical protein
LLINASESIAYFHMWHTGRLTRPALGGGSFARRRYREAGTAPPSTAPPPSP